MNEPIVSVRDVSHRYVRDWAIRKINFQFDRPGIVGLLGANGAGKSTIMNIICGVLYPTEGDVEILGASIRNAPVAAKQKIGFLPQQPPLYPEFTIEEYLIYCAELRRVPRVACRKMVEVAMEKCGIAHFRRRLIGALSGGYRQRVGIAQAILHEPGLVVLDEPTNGLDPNQILAVRKLILEVAEDRTVLLSTHILSEVEAVCESVLMISSGQVVFEGATDSFSKVVPASSVNVRFEQPPDNQEILNLVGVRRVDRISEYRARVHVSDTDGAIRSIVSNSEKHGWGLLELTPERSSLESVFAQLSGEG